MQSSPTKGSSTFFLSIHEDDGALMSAGFNIVVFALNLDDTWGYGLGVQTNGYAQGTTYSINQVPPVGTFTVTFTNATTFGGTFMNANNTFNLAGTKIF